MTGQSSSSAGSSGRSLRRLSHSRTTSVTCGMARIVGTERRCEVAVASISTAASIGTTSTLACSRKRSHSSHWASRSAGRFTGSSQPPG